jgi:isoleucyl-tRNA synthetase
MAFRPVDTKVSFPALELEVEAWWREQNTVRAALDHGDRSRPFIFFEGPPTANGRPGVHHVEARVTKDVVVRYHRQRGAYVIGARGGWDTQGLPVEIEVEKEKGFRGKPDIEKYGIEAFNEACKQSVWRYIKEFERLTERIAFWLDLDDPYVTYHNSYIESLWWIFKTLSERGLLFRDYKVTWHCPRCETSLSDHEVAQGYNDDTDDPSVWVRFRLLESAPGTSARPGDLPHPHAKELAGAAMLAWTTTPWTLPANVALAVNPHARYVLAEHEGERFVLAESLADHVLGEDYHVLQTFTGEQLVGLHYQHVLDGVPGPGDTVDWASAYRVVADDFVSLEDGTGVVHIAPAYGDLEIGRKYGLPTLFSVDLSGHTLHEFDKLGFGGMFFKDADPLITANLKERGLLFRGGRIKHTYPFCWRCDTALLNVAKRSWYIRTTAMKDRLIANNVLINWVPDHIKHGRFGNWLENNIDWAVSRERYWGTPLPIWTCESCGEIEVIGSVAELSERAGEDLSQLDLHRPYIDTPSWDCPACGGGTMTRVPDVADAWFDSGAMPIAQWHYPFENQDRFEVAKQADFISEGIDQTRGWFYTLHALATLLFDRPAYRNVICLGIINAADGRRMSKSRGTAVDPFSVIERYGADAFRWWMFAAAPPYNSRRFLEEQVGEMLRQFLLTLWNTYSFFVTYANLDGWRPSAEPVAPETLQPIDRWALASLNRLVREVTQDLDSYDIYQPTKRIERFVEELSNWYVRRNRRRFWKSESDADKQAAYSTLYTCLRTLAQLLAPFTPYLAEELYRNLVAEQDAAAPQSVHLTAWPESDASLIDEGLLDATETLLRAVTAGRAARKASGLKVRQPLQTLFVRSSTPGGNEGLRRFEDDLRDELNVKQVQYLEGVGLVEYRFKPNLRSVGRKYGKLVPALRIALEGLSGPAAAEAGRSVEEGRPFTLEVDGQTLDLLPEDVILDTAAPEGYVVAEEGGVLAALDTTLTPELRLEGAARDLVRAIQDARKEAGLAISDRIELYLQARDGATTMLQQLVAEHGPTVQAETLATDLRVSAAPEGAHRADVSLDEGPVEIGIVRRG